LWYIHLEYLYASILKRLHKDGGDLLCVLLVDTLNCLQHLTILVDDDGGGGGDLEVLLGGDVLVDIDLVGVGGGGVLVSSPVDRALAGAWQAGQGGASGWSCCGT
jgi:hypothetical protein